MNALYEASPSMWRNHPVIFIGIIVAAIFTAGLALIILIPWWLSCLCTRLTITDERVTLRRGILSKSEIEIRLQNVRMVTVHQSFFDRLLGVGRIQVTSAGTAGIEISVSGLRNPEKAKEAINSRGTK